MACFILNPTLSLLPLELLEELPEADFKNCKQNIQLSTEKLQLQDTIISTVIQNAKYAILYMSDFS